MRKILNILIAFLFLTAFIGIQINTHYSKGKLYSVAVYQEAESCCGEMHAPEKQESESKKCNHDEQDDCSCENITEIIKINDVFIIEKFTIPTVKSIDLISHSLLYNIESNPYSSLLNQITHYSLPPPLAQDFQAEFSIFLC
ncbi:MAG: hypothetical protein QM503_07015 [Bacteroidota bacterium]